MSAAMQHGGDRSDGSRLAPDDLLADMVVVLREGVQLSVLLRLEGRPLFQLACVTQSTQADSTEVALRALGVIEQAAERLGDGPVGRATRLLLGLTTGTRGLLLKYRRAAAADALRIAPETLRRHNEARLLTLLADEILRVDAEFRIAFRNAS